MRATLACTQLFELQVDRTPDAVVLDFGDGCRSRTGSWINALIIWRIISCASGIGPETRVGILLERSAEQAVALLGSTEGRRLLCSTRSGLSARASSLHVDDANVTVYLNAGTVCE